MNRLLSHQPQLNPHPAQPKQIEAIIPTRQLLSIRTNPVATEKSPSTNAKMSPTDYNPAKPLPLSQAGFHSSSPKRTHSPHIADQAVSRKPITASSKNGSADTTTSSSAGDFNRYQFEHSPTHAPSSLASRMSYTGDLEMDPSVRLEEYDWAELETQFAKRMEAFKAVEEGIWDEWRGWGEIFGAWAGTISVHDEERARKRLRTRIAFTRGAEEGLEAKRMHCEILCLCVWLCRGAC